MTIKFGRNYQLDIEIDPDTHETVVIRYPMTITFSVIRNTLASANTGVFSIYNLNETTRRKIYHDRYDTSTYRRIVLKAGYGKSLSIIYAGNLRQAYSSRRGADWVTEIDSFDGGFGIINGNSAITFPKKTLYKDSITRILKDMPTIKNPAIGAIEGASTRGLTLMGKSWNIINKLLGTQGEAFIDNERARVIKTNEVLDIPIYKINSNTGLLETPKRHDALLVSKMLFEPEIEVGQIVEVESLETIHNGQYKAVGVTHAGIISGSMNGECSTALSLWLGTDILSKIQ